MGVQLSVYISAYNFEDRIAWCKALGSYFKYAVTSFMSVSFPFVLQFQLVLQVAGAGDLAGRMTFQAHQRVHGFL